MLATTGILDQTHEDFGRAFLSSNTLPDWLTTVIEPAAVLKALRHNIPEFAVGALELQSCKIKQVRLKAAKGYWTGLYTIVAQQSATGERHTVIARGTVYPPNVALPTLDERATVMSVGSVGWECLLPELRMHLERAPSDEELPALPQLVDSEQARSLLQESISSSSPAYSDFQIAECAPQMMRSHPGMRHTLRYRLTYPEGMEARGWPPLMVAKTYDSAMGQHAYASMRALWESPLSAGDVVAIAEPLAYLPALNLLVQGPIYEEETLEEMVEGAVQLNTTQAFAELRNYIEQAAAGLAALHRSGVTYGNHYGWEGELTEIRDKFMALARPLPKLSATAGPLVDWLAAYDTAHTPDGDVPTHGAFRPAQVLIHQGRIGFIDFDGFCQAEPAMDLARFTAAVRDAALTSLYGKEKRVGEGEIDPTERAQRIAQIDEVCTHFLYHYRTLGSYSPARFALWEASNLLTLVLACWMKVKPVRLGNTLDLLEHRLRTMP